MKIDLRAAMPAPPAVVWPYLTDPARMNAWSRAKIRLLEVGDGGTGDGIGAFRRVDIPGPLGATTTLFEVIQHSEPPHRLVYRVARGPQLLRSHRGEQRIIATPTGCDVTWTVDAELALPGLGALAQRALERSLRASLRSLAGVVTTSPPPPPPIAARAPLAEPDLAPLFAAATACLADLHALANELTAADDRKGWFARVYELVTSALIDLARTDHVAHREWLLRLVPRFHHYYVDNLTRWRRGGAPATETHWALAFGFAESTAPRPFTERVIGSLLLGVRAHIDEDLPRALAEVYLDHFASRCDYARFRADYHSLAPVFRAAADRMLDELPPAAIPFSVRAARRLLPPEIVESLTDRRGYHVIAQRLEAFERGRRLAAWDRARHHAATR